MFIIVHLNYGVLYLLDLCIEFMYLLLFYVFIYVFNLCIYLI